MVKCDSKYGVCDINATVNIKDSFTIAEMSHIYIHIFVHLHHVCIIVNTNYYTVLYLYYLANPSSIVTGHFNVTCDKSTHGGTLSHTPIQI